MKELFKSGECIECNFYFCPICQDYLPESEHLAETISDIKVRWLANMVIHHRHSHITSWNKMWDNDRGGYYYQQAAHFNDYEEGKIKVNERAKRQIIRNCLGYLIAHEITKEHFLMLQNNDDPDTLDLLNKKLPCTENGKAWAGPATK